MIDVSVSQESRIKDLEDYLANVYVLFNKAQHYHWNVVGENFKDMHEFFESQYTIAGEASQLIATSLPELGFRLGLTICYDVRFPELFRRLRERENCDVCCVPSAFMQKTGEAHWEILLRARAIETQMYIVAAAQCGEHNEKRMSYGHSMIISPWGTILAQLDGQEESWCAAVFDTDLIKSTRESIPVVDHQRL